MRSAAVLDEEDRINKWGAVAGSFLFSVRSGYIPSARPRTSNTHTKKKQTKKKTKTHTTLCTDNRPKQNPRTRHPSDFGSLLSSLRRLVMAAATDAFVSTSQRPVVKLGLAGDTMLGRCVAEVIFQARQPDAPADSEREALPFYHKAARTQQPQQPQPPMGGAPSTGLFEPDVLDVVHEANLFCLNLECCISTSTQRWPNPHKPFFFRAPPAAVEDLKALRVDAVTLG